MQSSIHDANFTIKNLDEKLHFHGDTEQLHAFLKHFEDELTKTTFLWRMDGGDIGTQCLRMLNSLLESYGFKSMTALPADPSSLPQAIQKEYQHQREELNAQDRIIGEWFRVNCSRAVRTEVFGDISGDSGYLFLQALKKKYDTYNGEVLATDYQVKVQEVLKALIEHLYVQRPDDPVPSMLRTLQGIACGETRLSEANSNGTTKTRVDVFGIRTQTQTQTRTQTRTQGESQERQGEHLDVGGEHRRTFRVVAPTRMVKLFLSSTFTDMYSERERVVSSVIPVVQEWCNRSTERGQIGHFLQLLTVDLRWGVVEGATADETIRACLSEIEHCRELDPNHNPIFISFLSERVGWVPTAADVGGIREEFGWKDGYSVTEMEIERAVFMNGDGSVRDEANPNTLICFRDPAFLSTLAPERVDVKGKPYYNRYTSGRLDDKERVEATRRRLKSALPAKQWFDYTPRFLPGDSHFQSSQEGSVSYPQMEGFEVFERNIISFLKDRISRSHMTNSGPTVTATIDAHLSFVASCKQLLSRCDLLTQLTAPLLEHSPDCAVDLPDGSESNAQIEAPKPTAPRTGSVTLVTGGAGCGKSSTLAQVCHTLKPKPHPPRSEGRVLLFCHFAGLTTKSVDPHNMLCRLIDQCREWRRSEYGDSSPASSTTTGEHSGTSDTHHLVASCSTELSKLSSCMHHASSNRYPEGMSKDGTSASDGAQPADRLVIVIDALNQLLDSPPGTFQAFGWVPLPLPNNMHIICSSLPVPEDTQQPHERVQSYPEAIQSWVERGACDRYNHVRMADLPEEIKLSLIHSFLRASAKRLDDGGTRLLLEKKDSCNPLWLRLAAEELRVFGVFEGVHAHIRGFDDTLVGLVMQVIDRLCRSTAPTPNNVMKHCLCFIELSRHGMLETELTEIVSTGQREDIGDFPVILAKLRPYLRSVGLDQEGRLDFFHRVFSKAVRSRWFRAQSTDSGVGRGSSDHGVGRGSSDHGDDHSTVSESVYRSYIVHFMTSHRLSQLEGASDSPGSLGIVRPLEHRISDLPLKPVTEVEMRPSYLRVLEELPHQLRQLEDCMVLSQTISHPIIFEGLLSHFRLDLMRYWAFLKDSETKIGDVLVESIVSRLPHPRHSSLAIKAVEFLREKGDFVAAKRMIDQWQQINGCDHAETADAMKQSAALLVSTGKYTEALRTYEDVLKSYKTSSAEVVGSRSDVSDVLSQMGSAYRELRIHESALRVLHEALGMEKEAHGSVHPNVARLLSTIGSVHADKSEFEKAFKLFDESIGILRKVYGDYHPDIAKVLRKIAAVTEIQLQKRTGRNGPGIQAVEQSRDEVLRIYNDALDILHHCHGKSHPDIANILLSMGLVYGRSHQYEETRQCFLASRKMLQQFYGGVDFNMLQKVLCGQDAPGHLKMPTNVHPDVATELLYSSLLYAAEGNFKQATEYQTMAFVLFASCYGECHPAVANVCRVMGITLWNAGDSWNSIHAFRSSMEILVGYYEENHPLLREVSTRVQWMMSMVLEYEETPPFDPFQEPNYVF